MNAVGGALEACPSHILKHRLAVHIVASLPSHDELACQFVEGGGITHIWRCFCAPEGVLQDLCMHKYHLPHDRIVCSKCLAGDLMWNGVALYLGAYRDIVSIF